MSLLSYDGILSNITGLMHRKDNFTGNAFRSEEDQLQKKLYV